jgi:hypothetical protein
MRYIFEVKIAKKCRTPALMLHQRVKWPRGEMGDLKFRNGASGSFDSKPLACGP